VLLLLLRMLGVGGGRLGVLRGGGSEIVVVVVFLLLTMTTFVPAEDLGSVVFIHFS